MSLKQVLNGVCVMGKRTYVVAVKEVHVQHVSIEADSYEEAISLVNDGDGDEIGEAEYTCTLESDDWDIKGPDDNCFLPVYDTLDVGL